MSSKQTSGKYVTGWRNILFTMHELKCTWYIFYKYCQREFWLIAFTSKSEITDLEHFFLKKIFEGHLRYIVDVLWGQPIKQNQVASTSELHENQWNGLLFFEIVTCHSCRASEVQT